MSSLFHYLIAITNPLRTIEPYTTILFLLFSHLLCYQKIGSFWGLTPVVNRSRVEQSAPRRVRPLGLRLPSKRTRRFSAATPRQTVRAVFPHTAFHVKLTLSRTPFPHLIQPHRLPFVIIRLHILELIPTLACVLREDDEPIPHIVVHPVEPPIGISAQEVVRPPFQNSAPALPYIHPTSLTPPMGPDPRNHYSVSFLIDLKTSRSRRLAECVVVLSRRSCWHSVLIVVPGCCLVAECCRDRPAGRHTVRSIVMGSSLIAESRALGASAIQAICIVIGRIDRIAILGCPCTSAIHAVLVVERRLRTSTSTESLGAPAIRAVLIVKRRPRGVSVPSRLRQPAIQPIRSVVGRIKRLREQRGCTKQSYDSYYFLHIAHSLVPSLKPSPLRISSPMSHMSFKLFGHRS